MEIGFLVALFVILLVFCFLPRGFRKSHKAKKLPEAAGGWPIIGHLHLLLGSELQHITLASLSDKYGPIFRFRVGMKPALVVSSWEIAKELYINNDLAVSDRPQLTGGKYLAYDYMQFGFAPYGKYWRELRKITVLQLLSNHRLELLRHVRSSEVESSMKELYKLWCKTGSGASHVLSVEMKRWFASVNLSVILRMVVGKRYLSGEKETQRCIEAMRGWVRLAGTFVVRDAIPFLGFLDLGGHEKAMKKTADELDSIAEGWLEEHLHRKKVNEEEEDFMDVLLSSLQGVDIGGLDINSVTKATCLLMLTGAADTIVVALTWALSLLLNNRAALEKVQEELVTESDLNKLEYLQAAVKESMRLYQVGTISGHREFSEDCVVGGYHVPKGTRLLLNLWKMQRDPRVWSDPLEFKPERFLTTHRDVDVRGQHFELLPFGSGRRACSGSNLSLQMIQLVLASLLQSFEISTPGNSLVDMTASSGMSTIKVTPLEVMVKPRMSSGFFDHLYEI